MALMSHSCKTTSPPPPPPSTCAGDAGDVAGLADQILHDGQNPEFVPGVLQPPGQDPVSLGT